MNIMADRYRTIFFAIVSLTVVWFFIVLLCLPQSPDQPQATGEQLPFSGGPSMNVAPAATKPPSINRHTRKLHPPSSFSANRDRRNYHHPQHEDDDDDDQSGNYHYPRRTPQYMKYFQAMPSKRHRELSKLEIIFYQLPPLNEADKLQLNNHSDALSIPKDQHIKETLELRSTNNPTDRFVKAEGDRLFAFNLLVSNRIGPIRPLPDTRHANCLQQRDQPKETNHSTMTTTSQPSSSEPQHNATPPSINSRASIIICYYNEAPSALLRTIYSVLKRTDRQYLQEIVVVDDSSEPEYDINKVKPFIQDNPLVVLARTKKREGLIRARLFGSDLARGQILLFLDSHVEPNIDWIQPLIEVVRQDRATIACPIIDLINAETLIYSSSPLVKGGMNWALNFKWDSVPSDRLRTQDDFVRPIESPTMAGGLFAIDKDFFRHIGSYDPGMELWGGENIELSLRTWMCGGKIVIMPCSRVGHIFRKRRPYGPEPNQPDSLLLNSHRVARVWLDDYIDKFYEANPNAKYLVSGDVSKRLDLKQKLGCKNFSWFLENVYPDMLTDRMRLKLAGGGVQSRAKQQGAGKPNIRSQRQAAATTVASLQVQLVAAATAARGNVVPPLIVDSENKLTIMGQHYRQTGSLLPEMLVQFQIQSRNSDLCVESKRIQTGGGYTRLVLSHCARLERNNEGEILISNSTILDQIWTETELHDLRLGPNRCLDVFKNLPLLRKCHNMGSFQNWSHNLAGNNTAIAAGGGETNIFNTRAGLCLGVERVQLEEPIIVTICDKQTYERHNYTGAANSRGGDYQPWHRAYGAQSSLAPSIGWMAPARSLSGLMRHPSAEYPHLNQTRPSQSWNLLLVNRPGTLTEIRDTTTAM